MTSAERRSAAKIALSFGPSSSFRWMCEEFKSQPLGGHRPVVPLVLHAGGPRRAAEERQERAGDAAVGDRDRRHIAGMYVNGSGIGLV